MSRVAAIILAAGKGTRIGGPKALLAWPGATPGAPFRPLCIAHAETRLAAESARALVVARKPMLKALLGYVRPGIDLLSSDAADELGPAGSLAFAVPRLGDAEIVVVSPVDTPPARAETTAALLARLLAEPALLAVRPRAHGRTGHPVVLRVAALARYREPEPPPLRDHLRSLGELCAEEDVQDPNVLVDINTPADVMGLLHTLPRFLAG